MKQVVLITGGSGLLALNWALEMRDEHAIILGFHHRKLHLSGVQSQSVNLDSVDNVTRALDEIMPQVVIHTAGLTNVEQCEADPDLARFTNVEIAANVARACAKRGVRLIHVSTDHLFRGDLPLVDELQPVSPINTYGLTKAEAEQQVLAVHPEALVLRTNFYGWGPSYRKSFSDVIIQSLRSGIELTLFDDVYYTPILIEPLVLASHDLVHLNASGIFNLVADERVSKYEFGLKLAEKFGLEMSLIKRGSLVGHAGLVRRPQDMSLSNQKVCGFLGRKLGSVAQHIEILYQQEQNGFAQEIQQQ